MELIEYRCIVCGYTVDIQGTSKAPTPWACNPKCQMILDTREPLNETGKGKR